MVTGEPFVTTSGISRMHKLSVVSLDLKMRSLHKNLLYLVRGMVIFGLITYIVWEMKAPSRLVRTMDGMITIANTMKTHRLSAEMGH